MNYLRLTALAFILSIPFSAYSQTPFVCNDNFHVVFNNSGQLLSYDLPSDTIEIAPNSYGEAFNAFGYRVVDNFAYGRSITGDLVRLGSDGVGQNLGPIALLPNDIYPAEDFGPSGSLYLYPRADSSPPNTMYAVDVDTATVVQTIVLAGQETTFSDMAYHPIENVFYAVTNDNADAPPNMLVRIDLNTQIIETVGPTNLSDSVLIASMFIDGSGVVYGSDRIGSANLNRFNTQTGNATFVGRILPGPSQDGFFCSTNSGPFVKNVPTLSTLGLIALVVTMGIAGILVIRRRKVTA